MRIKPTAYGRATLAGSAIPASRPVGVAIAIGVAVVIENRTRRAITHLGSLQFRADRDSDGDPDSDTDPDEPGETPRFAGRPKPRLLAVVFTFRIENSACQSRERERAGGAQLPAPLRSRL